MNPRWILSAAAAILVSLAGLTSVAGAAGGFDPGPEREWREVQALAKPLPAPREWQQEEPGLEARREHDRVNALRAGEGAEKARLFYTRYPGHPGAGPARDMEYELLGAAVRLGATNYQARLELAETERLQDRRLPEGVRFQIRASQVLRPFTRPAGRDKPAQLKAMEEGARALQKEFPKRQEVLDILLLVAQALVENDNFDQARLLFKHIVSTGSGEVRDGARAGVRALDRAGKPVKMKFVTTQGGAVDVQAMKGKVVLVLFWASGNEACRALLAELKPLRERFQARGLEVVGVNFDQDRQAFERCLKENKIDWPQYFDGQMWQNRVGKECEITTLPTVWILDKQTRLRHLNARENLAPRIEKLLEEK